MQKIAINICYGGFSLSKKACEFLGLEWDNSKFKYSEYDMRTAPELIKCIETLGVEANGSCSSLKVCEIPDDVGDNWYISEYDGRERIEEFHRSWS